MRIGAAETSSIEPSGRNQWQMVKPEKIFFRGLGVIARVEHLDYWDGEER